MERTKSSGTQIEMDWTSLESAPGRGAAPPVSAPNGAGDATGAFLTDEEILGREPVGQTLLSVPERASEAAGAGATPADAGQRAALQSGQARVPVLPMPEWMAAAAGDPKHGVEAQQLWQEHQAFRAAFSSPDEARAIKELFPGGAQEAQALRQASQAVDQLDAAIYSGHPRGQSEGGTGWAAEN